MAEQATTRERILDTAGMLFYRDGFVTVGVDTITRESGVAKMTLYRHFPSKDELVVAYLERSNERFWGWFEGALGAGEPFEQLEHLYDAIGTLARKPSCMGCTFQHAANDFPASHPAHAVALNHKRAMTRRLRTLCEQAELSEPDELAAQLLLLMDGAFVAARMFPSRTNPAAHVGTAARALIKAHVR